MINEIRLSGKLHNANLKEFDGFNNDKNFMTQLMVSQYVGGGKGYNGTDYATVFFNIKVNSKLVGNNMLPDKTKVIIFGTLAQNKDAQNKTHTRINVEKLIVGEELWNGQIEQKEKKEELVISEDDSILWD